MRLSSPEVPKGPVLATGLGGPEPCKPSERCPPPPQPGHPVADIVSAPGPQGADGLPGHRRCRSQCQGVCQHSGNRKINILFLRRGVHPGQHTLRAGLAKPPRSRLAGRIPCLTKVEGRFQSTQAAKANVLPGCTRWGVGGQLLRQQDWGHSGHWFLHSCLQLGAPRAMSGHREPGL